MNDQPTGNDGGNESTAPGKLRRTFAWFRNLRYGETAIMVVLVLIIFTLWNTWIVYPVKLLVVFFHEISHAAMAYLTGGRVVDIQLDVDGAGMTKTQGGIRFLIVSAGYLGSLIWGGLFLVLAARTRLAKLLIAALGIVLLFVGVAFVRPLVSFGFVYCLVVGALCIAAALYLTTRQNTLLLEGVGLISCLYVIPDVWVDMTSRAAARSDATILAEQTGVPAFFWGTAWIILALALTTAFLLLATRKWPRKKK